MAKATSSLKEDTDDSFVAEPTKAEDIVSVVQNRSLDEDVAVGPSTTVTEESVVPAEVSTQGQTGGRHGSQLSLGVLPIATTYSSGSEPAVPEVPPSVSVVSEPLPPTSAEEAEEDSSEDDSPLTMKVAPWDGPTSTQDRWPCMIRNALESPALVSSRDGVMYLNCEGYEELRLGEGVTRDRRIAPRTGWAGFSPVGLRERIAIVVYDDD